MLKTSLIFPQSSFPVFPQVKRNALSMFFGFDAQDPTQFHNKLTAFPTSYTIYLIFKRFYKHFKSFYRRQKIHFSLLTYFFRIFRFFH